ncbi:hypothetical protein PGTUg99_033520 [Puccinia graminis f. sp. tritici]|uniref:Uncharacterized protein n=1 Tax=Puccinia graminis f. sp. tritici TaxID=56615 RepID=A0A5B0P5K6_PUCGR|nr:hypothetical protein PGTUg99_033520 [Puccinia graminis f. sp. tritici]
MERSSTRDTKISRLNRNRQIVTNTKLDQVGWKESMSLLERLKPNWSWIHHTHPSNNQDSLVCGTHASRDTACLADNPPVSEVRWASEAPLQLANASRQAWLYQALRSGAFKKLKSIGVKLLLRINESTSLLV